MELTPADQGEEWPGCAQSPILEPPVDRIDLVPKIANLNDGIIGCAFRIEGV
jgi:hypothetical protein